jgi:uncharacterized protein DUF2398
MTWFEHLNRERVRRVLNVLLEAPFFYRSDDPDLFAFLRKNRAELERFFHELYGWQLVCDARGARLYKERWYNPALTQRQHDVFDLARRDECIAFLLVLEFHEHLLDERNVSIEDPGPLRFEFGELHAYARARLQGELGAAAPDDDGVRRLLRGLMPTLLRYRFLAELEPEREDRGSVDRENLIYECLPGLYLYDVRRLDSSVLSDAYRRAAAEPIPAPVPPPGEMP